MRNSITVFYDDEVGSQLITPPQPPAPVFPTTPILDTFNRVDEDPINNSGAWAGPIAQNFNTMKVVGNQLQQSTLIAGRSGNAYWAANIFGPSVEVYVDIVTIWNNTSSSMWVWACGSGENTASQSGYQLFLTMGSGVWVWQLYRVDNAVGTQLGADIATQSINSGDAIGLSVSAVGVIQAWYKPSGSAWATLGTTRTDTTYTTGHIGVAKGFMDTTSILDNFGGGTASSGFFLDDMSDMFSLSRKPELW